MGSTAASAVNFWVCLAMAGLAIPVLWRLREKRHTDYEFVFNAFVFWLASWVVWTTMWGIAWVAGKEGPWGSVILGLSDLNTLLKILFYWGLVRGRTYQPPRYLRDGAQVLGMLGAAWAGLYVFGQGMEGGRDLHERWSLALSMFAPVCVGWAFKLRYNTVWVLMAGFAYAVAQPFAFEAVFSKTFSPDKAQLVLIVLAALKVAWATVVTYFVALTPVLKNTLIILPRNKPVHPPAVGWRWLIAIQVLVGLLAIGVVGVVYEIPLLKGVGAFGLTVLLAVIVKYCVALIDKLVSWLFGKWLRDTDDEPKEE
jgi:hypothetical protein